MKKPTQEQIDKWYLHKSNKEAYIEQEEYNREVEEDN